MELSKRLNEIANLITPVEKFADIGCDHGFLSIYLVENNLCQKVVAADINEGPLQRAKEHIMEAGLEQQIQTRLSNGLAKVAADEFEAFCIAGMGGPLGLEILLREKAKVSSAKYFIFQVQSELELVRYCFKQWGFQIEEEVFVKEDDKYYFIMKVIPTKLFGYLADWDLKEEIDFQLENQRKALLKMSVSEAKAFFYPKGIKDSNNEYLEYMQKERTRLAEIIKGLERNDSSRCQNRMENMKWELGIVEEAINEM